MILKSWGLLAVSAACVAGVWACAGGAEDDARTGAITGPCVPGQVFACVCPDGAVASRTCQPDGLTMSLCACAGGTAGSAGGASVGQPGAAGTGTGPGAGQAAPPVSGSTGNNGGGGMGGGGGAMMMPRAGAGGMSIGPGMMPIAGSSGMGAAGTGGSNANPGEEVPAIEHCAPVADWDPAWVAFEDEVLRLVNQNRAMGWNCDAEGQFAATGPLTTQPNLRCAARLHSQDMDMRDFFAHDNPDGDGPSERMDAAAYMGGTWGENIAMGQRTPEQVVSGWMESDGHCANIMRPQFTEIGVGFFQGADRSAYYWTQNFGAACTGRRCM